MTSPVFQLSPIKAIELAASKIPGVVSLAQGIPSFNTPSVIREYVCERIHEGVCDKYSLTTGLTELREEISLSLQKEKLNYDPVNEIIVTVGSIEGITASMLASTNPGDEVLLPSPTYASYLGAVSIAHCTPVYFNLDEDNNFDFDVEQIRKAITRKTKAILYCSPNNPTGTLFSESKTRALAELAEKHQLTVIIDEVYKDFYYTDDPHYTPASIPEMRKRIIRVCSFSKAYAMTGWRVGFLHSDSSVTQRILKYHDAMVTCAPVVSQYAAIAALRFGDEFLKGFRDEFKARRDYTIQRLDQLSHVLDYQMPKATYFAFPRIKDTVPLNRESEKLAYDILEKAHVAVVPGSAFGPSGESHLRITFGRSREDLEKGMDRLAQYFSEKRQSTNIEKQQEPEPFLQLSPKLPPSWRRQLISPILAACARVYLKRNKPLVIGIAGTTGKTILKRTIAELLRKEKSVRSSILSYNTEIGLPLSVLEMEAPRLNCHIPGFLARLTAKTIWNVDHNEILILEYGISSIEDAQKLSAICQPDWLIITDIGSSDPGVDCQKIQDGVRELAKNVPINRILWSSEDRWVSEITPGLLAENGFSESQVLDKQIVCSSLSMALKRELISRGSRLAVSASLILATKLGISRDSIQQFLAPNYCD